MTMKILLEEMEFYAFIGCSNEEKQIGTRFSVSLVLSGDFSLAAARDNLADAVNYVEVRAVVAEVLAQPANLLEAVASRIAHAIKTNFSAVENVEVTLRKLNPTIGGKCKAAAVVYFI